MKSEVQWCEDPRCTREHWEGHGLCSWEEMLPMSDRAREIQAEMEHNNHAANLCFVAAGVVLVVGMIATTVLGALGL